MKRSLICSLAGLLLLPAAILAAEAPPQPFTLTTIEGVVYKNAVVQSVDPDGLRIAHAGGVAKVPFEVLDDKMLAQYEFDPEKAAAYRAERALATAEQAEPKKKPAARTAAEEKEEAAFNLFRGKILTTIQSGAYDQAKLDATLAQWVKVYSDAGKSDWAALLEGDRKLLTARQEEEVRPEDPVAQRTRELEVENARLQDQIDLLRGAVEQSRGQDILGSGGKSVVYDSPYESGYFSSYSPSSVVYYSPGVTRHSCTPTYINNNTLCRPSVINRSYGCVTSTINGYAGVRCGTVYSGRSYGGGSCYIGGHSRGGGHSHGGGSCRR